MLGRLDIDQRVEPVFAAEFAALAGFVLHHACSDIGRHARVERTVLAVGEDVNVAAAHCRSPSCQDGRWVPAFAGMTQEARLTPSSARSCRHDRPIRSEEHTSELQSLMRISYAVFC